MVRARRVQAQSRGLTQRPNCHAVVANRSKWVKFSYIKGQGPGLVNVLWAERKTTSFNLWAEAQNDRFFTCHAPMPPLRSFTRTILVW